MARPREFDPDQALEAAMHLFWAKGYGATSIEDLVAGMGINRFSLYDTFGDKRRLFLAAIARYRDSVTGQLIDILDQGPGIEAIQSYFAKLAEALSSPMGRIGCLVQNSTLELAAHDQAVRDELGETNARVSGALLGALERARACGEVRARGDLHDCAEYLFALAQGMIVMAKAAPEAGAVAGTARFINQELESWR